MTNPRTMRDHLRGQLRDYLTLASGSMGRLVIALAYFLVAANVLSLADFGLFATASGAGIVLSRVAAFGFISPLFRAATVRPRLTGTYLAGYLVLFALSIPLLVAIAAGLRLTVFSAMPLSALVLILCAEVLGWRMLEVVAIINNGLRAFGKSTTLILAGSAIRTLAALAFWWFGYSSLTEWAWTYLAANLVAAALAFSVFLPPLRLRLRLALYGRQMRDALPAAAADIIFYLQAELDKAVVLVMAGPRIAGLYAIAMRIIDLTAMPIRSFNQLAMQKIMTDRRVSTSTPMLLLVELAIAAVSLGGLLAAMALPVPAAAGRASFAQPDRVSRRIALRPGADRPAGSPAVRHRAAEGRTADPRHRPVHHGTGLGSLAQRHLPGPLCDLRRNDLAGHPPALNLHQPRASAAGRDERFGAASPCAETGRHTPCNLSARLRRLITRCASPEQSCVIDGERAGLRGPVLRMGHVGR
ncbi:MAG: lipopolysaccharide biosynthesis protein [Beijerinckiaceae bacterium]|nr:lipopolysaccharide biosynthesis protein [Beijerinckiaceae bacterium]